MQIAGKFLKSVLIAIRITCFEILIFISYFLSFTYVGFYSDRKEKK